MLAPQPAVESAVRVWARRRAKAKWGCDLANKKENVLPETHCWECGEKLANPTQVPACPWCGKARHCGLNPDCTMEHHQAVDCAKRKKYLCCYRDETAPPACSKPLIRDQEGCWECGHKCEPTTQHERCQDWWLCPDCWNDHLIYCEANLPHRGKLELSKRWAAVPNVFMSTIGKPTANWRSLRPAPPGCTK
jgi:hypothetical protein